MATRLQHGQSGMATRLQHEQSGMATRLQHEQSGMDTRLQHEQSGMATRLLASRHREPRAPVGALEVCERPWLHGRRGARQEDQGRHDLRPVCGVREHASPCRAGPGPEGESAGQAR